MTIYWNKLLELHLRPSSLHSPDYFSAFPAICSPCSPNGGSGGEVMTPPTTKILRHKKDEKHKILYVYFLVFFHVLKRVNTIYRKRDDFMDLCFRIQLKLCFFFNSSLNYFKTDKLFLLTIWNLLILWIRDALKNFPVQKPKCLNVSQ